MRTTHPHKTTTFAPDFQNKAYLTAGASHNFKPSNKQKLWQRKK
jgi:hypothetical protein